MHGSGCFVQPYTGLESARNTVDDANAHACLTVGVCCELVFVLIVREDLHCGLPPWWIARSFIHHPDETVLRQTVQSVREAARRLWYSGANLPLYTAILSGYCKGGGPFMSPVANRRSKQRSYQDALLQDKHVSCK